MSSGTDCANPHRPAPTMKRTSEACRTLLRPKASPSTAVFLRCFLPIETVPDVENY